MCVCVARGEEAGRGEGNGVRTGEGGARREWGRGPLQDYLGVLGVGLLQCDVVLAALLCVVLPRVHPQHPRDAAGALGWWVEVRGWGGLQHLVAAESI